MFLLCKGSHFYRRFQSQFCCIFSVFSQQFHQVDGQQPLSGPMALSSFSGFGNAAPLLENSVRQKSGGIHHGIGKIQQFIFTFGAKYPFQAFFRLRYASYCASSITPVALPCVHLYTCYPPGKYYKISQNFIPRPPGGNSDTGCPERSAPLSLLPLRRPCYTGRRLPLPHCS